MALPFWSTKAFSEWVASFIPDISLCLCRRRELMTRRSPTAQKLSYCSLITHIPQRVRHSLFTYLHLGSTDSCLAIPVCSNTGWWESGRSCFQRGLTNLWVSPPSFVYRGNAGWRELLRLLDESHLHDKPLLVLRDNVTLVLFFCCFELNQGEESRARKVCVRGL